MLICEIFENEFLSYLWGIETSHVYSPFFELVSVFILPMRDWNKDSFYMFFQKEICFYPTYEGLKRIFMNFGYESMSLFLSYLWGIETYIFPRGSTRGETRFYPTYEGLKQEFFDEEDKKESGFYPTYEGLKPASFLVLVMPSIKFLSYLWGIETRKTY